jgi:hypothetical protein
MQFDRHGAVRLWSWLPVLAVVVHVLVAWCRRLLRVPLPSTTRARASAQREAQAPQVGVVVLEWMFPFSYFANTVVKILFRFILRITWQVSSYFAKKSVDKLYVTTKRKVCFGSFRENMETKTFISTWGGWIPKSVGKNLEQRYKNNGLGACHIWFGVSLKGRSRANNSTILATPTKLGNN